MSDILVIAMSIHELPKDLPIPIDDGLTAHLEGMVFPETEILKTLPDKFVVFVFPKIASDLEAKLDLEEWSAIAGARGCTPQSCAFRDTFELFQDLGWKVYGMSIQRPDVLKDFSKKNHIPFPILSDSENILSSQLNLPTFKYKDLTLLKRVTFSVESGIIKKVFYPVFPPNENASKVLAYLRKL